MTDTFDLFCLNYLDYPKSVKVAMGIPKSTLDIPDVPAPVPPQPGILPINITTATPVAYDGCSAEATVDGDVLHVHFTTNAGWIWAGVEFPIDPIDNFESLTLSMYGDHLDTYAQVYVRDSAGHRWYKEPLTLFNDDWVTVENYVPDKPLWDGLPYPFGSYPIVSVGIIANPNAAMEATFDLKDIKIKESEIPVGPVNNVLWYVSSNGAIVTPDPYNMAQMPEIVSNTYLAGKGIIVFANELTAIGNSAFYSSPDPTYNIDHLQNIYFPNSITTIGPNAFRFILQMKDITLPVNLESLGSGCFYMTGIKNIVIPQNVLTIPSYCFASSLLESITLPVGLNSIQYGAFNGCKKLTSVTIPNSVTSVGDYAFYGCSGLASVTISNSVTSIGEGSFQGCSGLTSIEIPNSVTSIKSDAFSGCTGLTSVTIGDGVTSIEMGAFYNCTGLTSVAIGNNVEEIGDTAFNKCASLTSVTIPNSVTSIENAAFKDCSSLTSITCEAITPPELSGSSVFDSTNNCPIYVPAESVDAYKAATNWSAYATRIYAIE